MSAGYNVMLPRACALCARPPPVSRPPPLLERRDTVLDRRPGPADHGVRRVPSTVSPGTCACGGGERGDSSTTCGLTGVDDRR